MAQTQLELEEKKKRDLAFAWGYPFFVDQFTINTGTSTVVNSMSTLTPSAGFDYSSASFDYYGLTGTAGAGFAMAPAATPAELQEKPYPRHIIRKLEKLAAGSLDDSAPAGEKEVMDWLHGSD